ncbi:MAG: hypothetical protein ACXITV_00605 [Luteibaculaceae bacterium]
MKKVLFLAALFAATTGFSQELVSKKGERFLPEAGDFAIGVDAAPFLNYFGNMFNSGFNPGFTNEFSNLNHLTGKMFIDENTAYRGQLVIGLTRASVFDMVPNASAGGNMVENTTRFGETNIGLVGGIEKRRGTGRLVGYYGGEAGIIINSLTVTNEFGNSLNADNTNGGVARELESKSGLGFTFGVRGFAGVEYFILPKMSLGLEYGWGLGFFTQGYGETTTERFDLGSGSVVTETVEGTSRASFIGFDTDNTNYLAGGAGMIRLNFHF